MATVARRPAEVAKELGVSTSTLRRWSQQFGDYLLSQAAQPTAGATGKAGHRRYTDTDVRVLMQVKQMMKDGLTVEEVRSQLAAELADEPVTESEVYAEEATSVLAPEDEDESALAVQPDGGEIDGPDIALLISNTLSSLSDSQQIILTGQQTSRQLLGVLLQDNFNLKEENTRLRERMVENERRVFEMKRELDEARSLERERMRQMESHLFEMQRRLDAIAEQRAVQRQPQLQPTLPQAQTPIPTPVYQTPAPVPQEPVQAEIMAEEPVTTPSEDTAPEQTPAAEPEAEGIAVEDDVQPAPQKRGFWAWLLGK